MIADWGPLEWSETLGAVATVGGVIWAWAKKSFIAREEHNQMVETMNERVEAVEIRALAMEASVGGLATKADVAGLALRMEEANGDRKALAESVRGIADSMRTLRTGQDRIETFLLHAGTER